MMRVALVLALFLASAAFLSAADVHAVEYIRNDSSFIDFTTDVAPPPPPPSDSGGSQEGTGTGSGQGSDPGSGTQGNGSQNPNGPAINTVILGGDASGGGNGAGSGGSEAGEGSEGSGQDEESAASELLGTLLGNQAIFVKNGGGSWSVGVNGAAVRRSLKARGVSAIKIPGFGDFASLFSGLPALRTGEDFAVVAASTALKNPGIEDIALSSGTLSLAYRARGNLLGFVPLTYRIRMEVNPDAADLKSRIKIRFPWYKFILQTYVSKKSLTADVEAAIAATPKTGLIDARAHLLAILVDSIQKRFDTVEASVTAN